MNKPLAETKFPWLYFALVYVLSLPFWILGPLADRYVRNLIPINLPVSALQAVVPVIAALIVVRRERGRGAGRELIKRTFDFRKISSKAWIVTAFLLVPFLLVVQYGAQMLAGIKMPDAQVPIALAVPMFIIFFIFGATEELGWSGYAIDRLLTRWTALGAAAFLGISWQLFHLIPLLEAPHSSSWVIFQILGMLPLRILLVWLYLNGGKSVFLAIVFHAMSNVAEFLFPNYGSYYNPTFSFVLFALAALTAIALWGPRTLDQYRFPRKRVLEMDAAHGNLTKETHDRIRE